MTTEPGATSTPADGIEPVAPTTRSPVADVPTAPVPLVEPPAVPPTTTTAAVALPASPTPPAAHGRAPLSTTPPPAPEATRAPAVDRERRHGTGLHRARLRLLGWFVGVIAFAIVVGLLLQRTVLLNRVDDEVEASLDQEVAELVVLGEEGIDPATGQPFASVTALFSLALARNTPLEGETIVAFVGGEPVGVRPVLDPGGLLESEDLRAVVREVRAGEPGPSGTIATPSGLQRYLAVPVDVAGAVPGTPSEGVYVVAVDATTARDEVDRTIQVAALVALSSLLLASMVSWVAAGRVLRPVRQVRDAARDITETDLRRRIPVEGDDEVAELASTFNAMLDRLQVAFETQRRFVDDAGHELRTPITVVQGHLDLLGDDPDERAETMALVQDELDRMGRIVSDLLLLATADRPDFVRPAPLELGELVDDVRARAVALDDRPWTTSTPPVPVTVHADRGRLLQAMVNLVANAARHTPSGTPVTIGAGLDDVGDAVLWVADEGPGVPAADQERVFERFARGSGGPRPAGGAGLGLSIVAAIATAHGGRIALESEPGRGARFSLHLPRTGPPAVEPTAPAVAPTSPGTSVPERSTT